MDVSNWTLARVDKLAKEWYDGLESGVFLPNRGKNCGTCGVARACYLASGDTTATRSYDRLNPRHGERSEEHTSELQSQSNLVCRLLLEKKKNNTTRDTTGDPRATSSEHSVTT